MNQLKKEAIKAAKAMLVKGRPLDFVKSVTHVTLAEMLRQGLAYEVRLPDPERLGHMVGTGMFRSAFPSVPAPKGPSNRRLKREDRKGFFAALRAERKALWSAVTA